MAGTDNLTTMGSLLGALAKALNLIDPSVQDHHQQTSYLSYMIAKEAGFSEEDLALTVYAALLHDIGFVEREEVTSLAELESHAKELGRVGASMLEGIPGTETVADIVRYCQSSWSSFLGLPEDERRAKGRGARIANFVHLADVVVTVIRQNEPIIQQAREIRKVMATLSGREFSEEAVEAFQSVSSREYVWLDLRNDPQFLGFFPGDIRRVSLERTAELTSLMSRIIDYRSAFTAMHSAGVAASAEALARFAGMSGDECRMMRIAGYLHDVGKLSTPRSILEKPGKLTEEEFDRIREHTYYTRLVLKDVAGFERITDWAALHHEKLDGSGYPFCVDASRLDLGSRIMAIADMYTAMTEIRPYREGMKREDVMRILRKDADSGKICKDALGILDENYDTIDGIRDEASRREGARYFASIPGQ